MVLFSILSLYIITHVHSISLETFSIFLVNFEFCRLSQLFARFLCKEHAATKLPQYISSAKPYFLSPDIAIIPYAAFAIYCIYRDTLLCLAYLSGSSSAAGSSRTISFPTQDFIFILHTAQSVFTSPAAHFSAQVHGVAESFASSRANRSSSST